MTGVRQRRQQRARRTGVVMAIVLVVSTSIVTAAAVEGGAPPAAAAVCPGAKAAAVLGPGASAGGTSVRAGALPAQLVARPDRLRLLPVFRQWAAACSVPAPLVEATCWWESGWQEAAVSVTGAVGVCQIEPAAAQTVRRLLDDTSLDPRSPSDNIEISAAYLRWLLNENSGRRDLALASYYQGLSSVKRHGILAVSKPYVTGITALLHDYTWS